MEYNILMKSYEEFFNKFIKAYSDMLPVAKQAFDSATNILNDNLSAIKQDIVNQLAIVFPVGLKFAASLNCQGTLTIFFKSGDKASIESLKPLKISSAEEMSAMWKCRYECDIYSEVTKCLGFEVFEYETDVKKYLNGI